MVANMTFDKKRLHLVPIMVTDLGDKIQDPLLRDYQLDFYLSRLQAIRDYVDYTLDQYKKKKK